MPVAWFGSRSCPSQLQFVPIGVQDAERRCGLSTMAAKSLPRQRFQVADWMRRDRRPDLTNKSSGAARNGTGYGVVWAARSSSWPRVTRSFRDGLLREVGCGKAAAGLGEPGSWPSGLVACWLRCGAAPLGTNENRRRGQDDGANNRGEANGA